MLKSKNIYETPFVTISKSYRYLLIITILLFILLIGCRDIFFPQPIPSSGYMTQALQINLLLVLFPFIFYKPIYGWFHPIIFTAILEFIYHLRRISIYLEGIQSHYGIPGWSENRLTQLLAYELALRSLCLVFYYVGFFYSPKYRLPSFTFPKLRNLSFKVIIVVVFSTLLFFVFMLQKGGISEHLISWSDAGRSATFSGNNYLLILIRLSPVACLLWFALDKKVILNPSFWICSLVSLITSFLTNGSRGAILKLLIFGLILLMFR